MKVKIKDYQAIKTAELEFVEGVNVIVGSTNNGKSSIIRAIQGAINNQGGSGFINYNADETEVTINDNENKLVWTKSKKAGKSSYTINGEVLTKIGQKQLPEVADLLNMHEVEVGNERFQINFWKQMEKPFLVDRTPYQLFDFISQSKEQAFVAELQNSTSAEYKELNASINSLNSQIDILTDQITNLHSDIEALSIVESIDIDSIEYALTVANKLTEALKAHKDSKEEVETLQVKHKLLDNITEKVHTSLVSLDAVMETLSKLNKLIREHTTYTDSIAKLIADANNLDAKEIILSKKEKELKKYIKEQEELNTTYKELNRLLSEHSNKQIQVNKLKAQLVENEKLQVETSAKLQEFSMCPLCGHALDEIHTHKEEVHD